MGFPLEDSKMVLTRRANALTTITASVGKYKWKSSSLFISLKNLTTVKILRGSQVSLKLQMMVKNFLVMS